MKFRMPLVALAMSAVCTLAAAEDGVVTVASPFTVQQTYDRLTASVLTRNLVIAAQPNHSAAAASVGLVLPPTRLMIFGSPLLGTPLMQCKQTIGIDLPLKALVWQNAEGKVFLTYNDLKEIGKRHDLNANNCPALATVKTRYEALMAEVVDPTR